MVDAGAVMPYNDPAEGVRGVVVSPTIRRCFATVPAPSASATANRKTAADCFGGRNKPMKEIPLTRGKVALVDDADYERLNEWKWCATSRSGGLCYARREVNLGARRSRVVYMHREVLGAPAGAEVDHVNGDGLDNRRENIRLCTHAENQRWRPGFGGTSQYKGVHRHFRGKKWVAQIKVGRKTHYIGIYDSEDAAAIAYNTAAVEHFGEFAWLNVIAPSDQVPEEFVE